MNIDAERDRLMGLAEKASPGPWKARKPEKREFRDWSVLPHRPDIKPPYTPSAVCECNLDEDVDGHNAKFIAAAHDMIALIDAQAAEIEQLRASVIEECAKVCEAEEVDGTVSREDRAYNMALEHAATAIRALKR